MESLSLHRSIHRRSERLGILIIVRSPVHVALTDQNPFESAADMNAISHGRVRNSGKKVTHAIEKINPRKRGPLCYTKTAGHDQSHPLERQTLTSSSLRLRIRRYFHSSLTEGYLRVERGQLQGSTTAGGEYKGPRTKNTSDSATLSTKHLIHL